MSLKSNRKSNMTPKFEGQSLRVSTKLMLPYYIFLDKEEKETLCHHWDKSAKVRQGHKRSHVNFPKSRGINPCSPGQFHFG